MFYNGESYQIQLPLVGTTPWIDKRDVSDGMVGDSAPSILTTVHRSRFTIIAHSARNTICIVVHFVIHHQEADLYFCHETFHLGNRAYRKSKMGGGGGGSILNTELPESATQ